MTQPTDTPIIRVSDRGQWIDGQWRTGQGDRLESICPVDQSTVWSGAAATADQVDAAVVAARRAAGPWGVRPAEERIEFVRRFAEAVESRGDELAQLISSETGKPLWETRTEVAGVVGKIPVSIDAFHERRDTHAFALGELQAVTRFKPIGVMGVLGPFNFPAHLPNGHIVPALIAGNTVVFKPSEQSPAVGQWLTERWAESGLPAGVFNLVQGERETGAALAQHPQLDGLLFTGSSAGGRALHRFYGDYPQKILALEMGGNNPLLVHQVGDRKAAAYLTVLSAYITAGQRCSCARRLILVEGDESDAFLAELVEMIGRLRIGYHTDQPEPFAATVISARQGTRLQHAFGKLVDQGGRPLIPLERRRDNDALLAPALIDVTEIDNRSDEELFGPILTLIRVKDFDQALTEANRTAYGLSAALLSDSAECYQQFIQQIRAGVVNWNRQTTGATGRLPFGGCGLSGNYRPSAYFAADYCSYPVASLESTELALPDTLTPGIELHE